MRLDNSLITGSLSVSGSIITSGTITATTLVVQTVTSSTDFVTGSTQFGSLLSNTHQFTGSVGITGSLTINGTSYTAATSGTSGTSGTTGTSGTSGTRGTSGTTGTSGTSGTSGGTGANGTSGTSGTSGTNAGITSYTNPGDNRVITSVSATTINAESNLIFDGNNLGIGITPSVKLEVSGAIRGGSFPNSTTNSGEVWFGRAADRTLGTMTFQLGGSSATNTAFEIVDRAWTKVMYSFSGEAPANSIAVNSSGTVSVVALTETSSERYKENIITLTSSLDKVTQMRGVTYTRKDTGLKEVGVIAEEINEIFPELVTKNQEGEIDSVSYGRFAALLIEAVKEQQQQINELKQEINILKNK